MSDLNKRISNYTYVLHPFNLHRVNKIFQNHTSQLKAKIAQDVIERENCWYWKNSNCISLRISPYSVRMQENADQNNSEYGHFSRSAILEEIFEMTRNLCVHPAWLMNFTISKFCYSSYMVIITLYNSKILLSLHYFLTPQFQTFTNLLIGIFGVSNPTFFFFFFCCWDFWETMCQL